ncbi:MAG: hypothetical protein ABI594_20845 [Ginsengibacter sp.]
MEIDELKDAWKNTVGGHGQQRENIMEMIQHDSSGPVAALKKAFRKQYRFIIIVALIVLNNLTHGFSEINFLFFFSYLIFCGLLSFFFYQNYRMIGRIEKMDGLIKTTVEQQITWLESRLKTHLAAVRIALLFFIALAEVLPYFQHGRMLDKWHALSPYLRVLVYVSVMALQYFISRGLSNRRFGRHLRHLKELVVQLQ